MMQTNGGEKSAKNLRRFRKAVLWTTLVAIVLILVAYLGIGGVAASILTQPKRVVDTALTPDIYHLAYEDLRIPARGDALEIAAWFVPSDENQRAIILVHGRDDSRSKGFGFHEVDFANQLHRAGFSVMMIDLRGHGDSADSRFTFGIRERRDILGAVDWLQAQGYQPGSIGVLGYSLGAASVIGAAAEEPNISAIWIDSSYADIKSVIERNWQNESGLPQVFLPSALLMIRVLYGYDITVSRPVDELSLVAPRPIYIAHCVEDAMIPIAHMDQLLAVAKDAQSWVIPDCEHAVGYSVYPMEYTRRAVQFFDGSLK